MDSSTDIHVEAARIQKEIRNYLGLGSSSVVFEFHAADGGRTKLDMITINPRHSQSFLFHSTTGYDKIDSLNKMLDYVKDYKEKESSYTIQWAIRGERDLHTSYFSAPNIYGALEKLYYGRDMNQITVFSVVLNPIS
ncbi:hypothetical protein AB9P05_04755 [Roseivirga sp. BDSF3-8]|uniref:hypothetical protein n=1 Tax=Roseivirga sp. BDSF3-8 TaxID=3241598 RepID=UPI003531E818